jgi:hypothetical protein
MGACYYLWSMDHAHGKLPNTTLVSNAVAVTTLQNDAKRHILTAKDLGMCSLWYFSDM